MTNIYFESILMAFDSIFSNKMRSLLTMLGIIIGVAAVIALMSLGYGVRADIENNIASLGSNQITIIPGTSRKPGVRPAAGSMQSLTYKDYLAVKNLPNVSNAAPLVSNSYVVVSGNKNWTTNVYGVTSDYLSISDLKIAEGRYWNEQEYTGRERVCVIGKTVATGLFGSESPVGQKIRIKGNPFTVIGVLESKGYSFIDQDDRILSPFTTVQERMMGITYVSRIVLTADDSNVLPQIEADVTNLLRTRHRIVIGKEDDFNIQNSQDLLETMESTTQTLTVFLGSIAAISLLVGGIGIMNIMYVSVTERTREIGLRMSVGARGVDILSQFLIEAIMISITGGIIGVIIGCGASWIVKSVAHWPIYIQPWSVFLSFAVCTVTGVFFGWYPAKKAADLDPIEAIRYE